MPSFCRHGRLEVNCKICSPTDKTVVPARRTTGTGATPRRTSGPRRAPTRGSAGGMVVRKMARSVDDGYGNELVLGLRSSVDAGHLADELAFATARLRELSTNPPGLYAEVAAVPDPEEAIWLGFLIAWLQPLAEGDPWAGITAARVPWATGEIPVLDGVPTGPRGSVDPGRAPDLVAAYRAFAQRAGSQHAALAGEAAWTSGRRFDRGFERLALRGLSRAARFDFLATLGALGVLDVEATSMQFSSDAMDPSVIAAKRVFGIGDAINLGRRASDLAAETGVPIAALDLALANWGAPPDAERITAGSTASIDPVERERIATALGVGVQPPEDEARDDEDDAAELDDEVDIEVEGDDPEADPETEADADDVPAPGPLSVE